MIAAPVRTYEFIESPVVGLASARPRWFVSVTVALLLLGVVLRAIPLVQDRPLWIDEAMLALNIQEKSFAELIRPLDRNQAAPFGYLFLVKTSVTILGPSEFAFRLPAFVGSLFGLLAMAFAAKRWLNPRAALLALALFAVNPMAISYAAEVKQYAFDIAFAALLLGLVPKPGEKFRVFDLAFAGSVAIWFSFPAVFVLFGIGLALLLRNRTEWKKLAILFSAWFVSFAALYFLQLKATGQNAYLTEFWRDAFLPLSSSGVPWLIDRLTDTFGTAGGFGAEPFRAAGLAALVGIAGVIFFWRDRMQAEVGMILGIVGAVLLASALHKYPVAGRLMAFAVPLTVLLVARGAMGIVELLPKFRSSFAIALLVALIPPTWECLRQFKDHPRREELPAALKVIPADEPLYVYNGYCDAGAGPAFAFYRNRFTFETLHLGGCFRDQPEQYEVEIEGWLKSVSSKRVWAVFSHRHSDEELRIRLAFEHFGKEVERKRFAGAAAYCYELNPKP